MYHNPVMHARKMSKVNFVLPHNFFFHLRLSLFAVFLVNLFLPLAFLSKGLIHWEGGGYSKRVALSCALPLFSLIRDFGKQRFQNFRQSCALLTDQIEIHQLQPLV